MTVSFAWQDFFFSTAESLYNNHPGAELTDRCKEVAKLRKVSIGVKSTGVYHQDEKLWPL